MRYIDVYREYDSDSGFLLVTKDCIQTDKADISRQPNAKSFTMADGSFCLYPSAMDSAAMTLSLECSGSQANALASAVRFGRLYFAGMRAGGLTSHSPTDANYFSQINDNAFVGYLTENATVRILEIEAAADLFSVRIPLKLLLDSYGKPKLQTVPVLKISSLSLFGTAENFSGYAYKKGIFYRKNVIFTSETEAEIAFSYSGSVSGLKAAVFKNQQTFLNWDVSSGKYSGTLPLTVGENCFTFQLYTANSYYKHAYFQFVIYRNPSIS
ncbi:MAG: hypothetical protein IJJ69_04045 [Oscillospiraceae bacterium]|nr:hypothetical protein [Oscillospiraceae bacterium]